MAVHVEDRGRVFNGCPAYDRCKNTSSYKGRKCCLRGVALANQNGHASQPIKAPPGAQRGRALNAEARPGADERGILLRVKWTNCGSRCRDRSTRRQLGTKIGDTKADLPLRIGIA